MLATGLRNIEVLKLVLPETWQAIAIICGAKDLLPNGKFDFAHFQKQYALPIHGPEFHDAIEVINELGTDDGRNTLLTAIDAVKADISTFVQLPSHELAAQIWLQSRNNNKLKAALVFARYRSHDAKKERTYREFVGASALRPLRPPAQRVEAELQAQLKKLGHIDACRIYVGEDDAGEWHYDIIRGDAAKSVLAFDKDGPNVMQFLAGAGDHIRYDPQTNLLGISTRSPRVLAAYRAMWGTLIAGNSTFFDGENICTLQPLQKNGAKLFANHGIRSISEVAVTELSWRNEKNEKVNFRAPDSFKVIRDFGAVPPDGHFVEAKLALRFVGQRPLGRVTIKPPNILDINAGVMQPDVERLLNQVGIRGPFDEEGKKEDFWSIVTSALPDTDWRRRIGADFERLVGEDILKPITLGAVSHPAHPHSHSALAVKMDEQQTYYGISEEDDAIEPRILTSTDVTGYRLDLAAMMDEVAKDLGLSGVCQDLDHGIWSLGYRDFGTAKIAVFIATKRLTAAGEKTINNDAAYNGRKVLIVPDDTPCQPNLPAVVCRMPHGPFRLWEDIVLRLKLQNDICPSQWANADLVINTELERIYYKGVELTKIVPGSQPYIFAAKLIEAKGRKLLSNELGKQISDHRIDGKVCTIAKNDFNTKLVESFQDAGKLVPDDYKDIFVSGAGWYRLNCNSVVVPLR